MKKSKLFLFKTLAQKEATAYTIDELLSFIGHYKTCKCELSDGYTFEIVDAQEYKDEYPYYIKYTQIDEDTNSNDEEIFISHITD